MCSKGWLALGLVGMVGMSLTAHAGDTELLFTPRPSPVLDVVVQPAPPAETPPSPPPVETPSGTCATSGSCATCTTQRAGWLRSRCRDSACGESKMQRFWSWLIYIPENRGCVDTCCNGVIGAHPPGYVYFPCPATTCDSGCAAGSGSCTTTLYYAKQPAGTSPSGSGVVVQGKKEWGGETESNGATASRPIPAERRISTFKPNAIATNMPILAPDQFKQLPSRNSCGTSQR